MDCRVLLCSFQSKTNASILTGYIEENQPFVSAHLILGGAHVQNRNAGIANVKLAHCLQGEKSRDLNSSGGQAPCCRRVCEPDTPSTQQTHVGQRKTRTGLCVPVFSCDIFHLKSVHAHVRVNAFITSPVRMSAEEGSSKYF